MTTNRKWPMGNRIRDRWRHVTPKGHVVNPITLRVQYRDNSWRCYYNRYYQADSL